MDSRFDSESPMDSKKYCVYIMSSLSGVLYIGMTGHLEHRIREHKEGVIEGFTKKYKCRRLVYYEIFQYVNDALEREKQLKRWSRGKKLRLIMTLNPKWEDLGAGIEGGQ
jgi:putative endonuclease